MANIDDKHNVDEMGIRLAPPPMDRRTANQLPAVRQDFVLRPVLDIDEPEDGAAKAELSTADDFQPKRRDLDKRWKRGKRSKNIVCGLIMFIVSSLVLLPYILAAVEVKLDFIPFAYIPTRLDVFSHYIDSVELFKVIGWTGESASIVWKMLLPDFMLTLGLLFILFNWLKSVTGICGAVKVRRYLTGSVIYLVMILAVLIAALVGAEEYGIAKIGFKEEFIQGWQTSDFVGLLMIAVGNIIVSAVCSFINPDRSGYTK